MIPFPELMAFALAGLVLNLTPGQDVMFATASGLSGGPRAGAMAGVGVALGCMVHVVLAALGLAALIAAHPAALTAIRWGGAAYLLFLAYKSWTSPAVTDGGQGARTLSAALRNGFLGNLLNPKTIVFILAFLPQFVEPARGPVWQQILLLGALFSVTGMAVTAGFGYAAGIAGQRITARLSVLNKVAAVVFAGLAARLMVMR